MKIHFYVDDFKFEILQQPPFINATNLPLEIGTEDALDVQWNASSTISLDSAFIYFSDDSLQSFNLVEEIAAQASNNFLFFIPDSKVTDYAAIMIRVSDIQGNSSSDTSSFFSIIDNTPPSVLIYSPSSATVVPEDTDLAIDFDVFDNIDIDSDILFQC